MRWIVFISQTGSEVMRISTSLYIYPTLIVTNDYDRISEDVREWIFKEKIPVFILPNKPTIEDYRLIHFRQGDLITLHGYLRILPREFIENINYKIYNGHPGLITDYPELKGLNPQIRAWEGNYDVVGSVIHKVTRDVDEGEILVEEREIMSDKKIKLNDYFEVLKECSFRCWERFFKERLYDSISR